MRAWWLLLQKKFTTHFLSLQLPSWGNPHGPLSWLAAASKSVRHGKWWKGRMLIHLFPDPSKSWLLLDGHVPSILIWEALHLVILETYVANGSAGTDPYIPIPPLYSSLAAQPVLLLSTYPYSLVDYGSPRAESLVFIFESPPPRTVPVTY